jgi:hypothetical protein
MSCTRARNAARPSCLRAAALLAAWVALLVPPALAQTRAPATREELIQQIQSYADGDVAGGAPMNAESAVSQFQDNKFGLTPHDIRDIYRERYLEDREKKKPWWDRVPRWLYPVLIVLAIFWRPLKNFLEDTLKKFYEALYTRYAGAKLFRRRALARYRNSVLKQHEDFKIPFRDAPLAMREVYVPLKVSATGSMAPVDAMEAIRNHRHLIVKGVPGSGKSMLLHALLLGYADGRLTGIENDPVPVLVELSRLNDSATNLQKQLVASFDRYGFPNADSFVVWALEHGSLLLLLDGLDEVNAKVNPDTNASRRSTVVSEINDLKRKHDCRFVVTCRTQVYRDEFATTADRTLEVAEFADSDILRFLKPWEPAMKQDQSVEQLMQTLRERPRILLLARNPLLLTMIAYLYADQHMALPHSRAEFYRQSTTLLLEKWQREFNRFGVPPKAAVLSRLALRFQAQPAEDQDRRSLTYEEVLQLVREVLPGTTVKSEDAGDFLDEIVDRNGLLLRIDGGTRFQFTHLTIQEYFAGTALAGDGPELLEKFSGDSDTWREVVKLWCGLAQDSTEMITEVHSLEPITAIECLADAKYIKPEVADKIVDEARVRLVSSYSVAEQAHARLVATIRDVVFKQAEYNSVAKAFGLLASVPGPRGAAMLDWLTQQLSSDNPRAQMSAAMALAYSNLDVAAQRLLAHNSPVSVEALKMMGDVAVRPLVEAGASAIEQGYAVNNYALLIDIATPRSLEAAVSLLWNPNKQLSSNCAIVLAQRFAEFHSILRDVPASFLGPGDAGYEWVWQPFQEPKTSSLPKIAARIVSLLAGWAGVYARFRGFPEDFSRALSTIDPRLALPLYASAKEALIASVFEATPYDLRWYRQIFMQALPENVRTRLRERIAQLREPEKLDWLRIFQPATFDFEKSRHMLFLKILLSTVLVAWVFSLYKTNVFSPPFGWWKAVVALIAGVNLVVAGINFRSSRNAWDYEVATLGTLGIYPFRLRHDLFPRQPLWTLLVVAVVMGSCLPLVIYFCSLQLAKFLGWPVIVGLWVVLYAMAATVRLMGRLKEFLARNPLQGLIEPPAELAPARKPPRLAFLWRQPS